MSKETRHFKYKFSLIGVLMFLFPFILKGQMNKKPNIIVFIADDLGWQDIGPFCNTSIKTPNLNSLAKEGCCFDRVFLTASSSSPSRASILTALYPHETRAAELHQPLDSNKILATTPLKKSGYFTACVGKWHLGNNVKSQFDLIRSSSAKETGIAWVDVIRMMPKEKPFFLWAASYDPHRGQPVAKEKHAPEGILLPDYLPYLPEVKLDYARYYNQISRFDRDIGMVLEELKKKDIYENTIIVVMSDNGSPMPTAKTRTNKQGMKTPLIIIYPSKIRKDIRNQSLISSIDIMPTLLDWAGTKFPNKISGKSFRHIAENNINNFRAFAFSEHNWHDFRAFERAVYTDKLIYNINYLPHLPATPPNDVVTSEAYKVFRKAWEANELSNIYKDTFISPRSREELWNYVEDPNCQVNLIDKRKYKKQKNKMRKVLENHMKLTNDFFPGENSLTPDMFNRSTGEKL